MALRTRVLLVIGCGLGLAGLALGPPTALAGVPRSCIHPRANPIECPRDTWRVTLDVLPATSSGCSWTKRSRGRATREPAQTSATQSASSRPRSRATSL